MAVYWTPSVERWTIKCLLLNSDAVDQVIWEIPSSTHVPVKEVNSTGNAVEFISPPAGAKSEKPE